MSILACFSPCMRLPPSTATANWAAVLPKRSRARVPSPGERSPISTVGSQARYRRRRPNNSPGANSVKEFCRAPDAPLSPPRCYLRGQKRIIARPLHIQQPLPERSQRQKRGLCFFRQFRPCDLREIPTGVEAKFDKHGAKFGRRPHRKNVVGSRLIVPKDIQRDI